jgi:hypothetical protein
VAPLAQLVADVGPAALEDQVFGTFDPAHIADRFGELLADLDAPVDEWLWYVRSVACVAGARLADGREVVVRAFQPTVRPAFLDGVIRVQDHLARAGFPAARPLSGSLERPWGLGRIETLLADPGARRLGPEAMPTSAAGLARLVELAAEVDPTGLSLHPMVAGEQLYPTPHSPLFDFERTATGAEWIDAIAAPAKAVVEADDTRAVSHGDWSARNVRFAGDRIVAVYDFESLEQTTESTSLGVAAATWRSLGEGDDPIAPARGEIERYLDLYDEARSQPLTPRQRRAARGMAVYALAYTARCEHALRPGIRDGRATARLSQDGPDLLAMLD